MSKSAFINSKDVPAQREFMLDQTTIHVDSSTFEKIVDWMNSPPTEAEVSGMRRLRAAKAR